MAVTVWILIFKLILRELSLWRTLRVHVWIIHYDKWYLGMMTCWWCYGDATSHWNALHSAAHVRDWNGPCSLQRWNWATKSGTLLCLPKDLRQSLVLERVQSPIIPLSSNLIAAGRKKTKLLFRSPISRPQWLTTTLCADLNRFYFLQILPNLHIKWIVLI